MATNGRRHRVCTGDASESTSPEPKQDEIREVRRPRRSRDVVETLETAILAPGCTLALDQLIANKPQGLIQAQRASFHKLHERLLEIWAPEHLVVNIETGCIAAVEAGETRVLFLQAAQDQLVRQLFRAFRDALPPGLRIHGLPLDHVGALATLDFEGAAGFASEEAEDFVAISSGVLKLRAWGLAVAKSLGADVGQRLPSDSGVAERPQSWWNDALRILAYDILGCTVDPGSSAYIAAYVATAEQFSCELDNMSTLMEGFVVLHEIGHHELGHGRTYRARGLNQEPESNECYRMEAEADTFAMEHLVQASNRNAVVSTVCLVFLLFAMSPELLSEYPFCLDGTTHPHPLTRLVWLLRKLYPQDPRTQAKYLNFVIDILVRSGEWEGSKDMLADAIRYVVLAKGAAPDTR